MNNLSVLLSPLVFAVLFYHGVSSAQIGWSWSNPFPQGNRLNAIHCFDSVSAIAVGDDGTIIKTTDAGTIWDIQHSVTGSEARLNSVSFSSDLLGFAVGELGTILETSDGGLSWNRMSSGTTRNLFAVAALDSQTAIVSSTTGRFFRSSDGGSTWNQIAVPGISGNFFGMSFLNSSRGVAISSAGRVLATSNGGLSWDTLSQVQTSHVMRSIYWIDSTTMTCVGDVGTVMHSTDAGLTWLLQYSNVTSSLRGVRFFDRLDGVAIGSSGTVIATTDGGLYWQPESIGTTSVFFGISSDKQYTVVIIGDAGQIFSSTDRGTTWQEKSRGATDGFFALDLHSDVVTAVGSGGLIYQLPDASQGWFVRASGVTQTLRALDMRSSGWGIASGDTGTLLRTTDGGASWTAVGLDSARVDVLNGVVVLGESVAVAAGGRIDIAGGEFPIVLRTTDRGDTWQSQQLGVSYLVTAIAFSTIDSGVAVGTKTTILRTTDGGVNWSVVSSGLSTMRALNAVTFFDAQHGAIAGDSGIVLYTSDGGATWKNRSSGPFSIPWFGVDLLSPDTIVVAGALGTFAISTDTGVTWVEQPTGTLNTLRAVAFRNSKEGFVVGSNGTILYTNTGGVVTGIEDPPQASTAPLEFRLEQNYPNPFNPVTNFGFRIAPQTRGVVTLKVYDLLGREVATVMNEVREPGAYTVQWDAAGMPSGVYISRLTSGKFSASRKLLLLR